MTSKVHKCRPILIHLRANRSSNNHRLLHNGPDTLEELLDRHVVKKEKSLDDDENELVTRQRLTSTHREALSLYRDIIRASRFFLWPDSRGVLWRDEAITCLLIGGHEVVQAALDKLVEKQKQQIEMERSDLGHR